MAAASSAHTRPSQSASTVPTAQPSMHCGPPMAPINRRDGHERAHSDHVAHVQRRRFQQPHQPRFTIPVLFGHRSDPTSAVRVRAGCCTNSRRRHSCLQRSKPKGLSDGFPAESGQRSSHHAPRAGSRPGGAARFQIRRERTDHPRADVATSCRARNGSANRSPPRQVRGNSAEGPAPATVAEILAHYDEHVPPVFGQDCDGFRQSNWLDRLVSSTSSTCRWCFTWISGSSTQYTAAAS